jgi:uncharacterized membrane protein YbhN (UPF0104 family)
MPQIKILPRAWINRIQAAIVGAILGSIISVIIKLWSQIRVIQWHFDAGYLLISILISVFTIIEWAVVWSWMLQKMNRVPNSLHQIINIYIYGNISKYLPGSVWNYVARGYLGQKKGIGISKIGLASVIEIIVSINAGLFLYYVSLFWPHIHRSFLPMPYMLAGIVILLITISPPIIKLIDSIQWKIRRRIPEDKPSFEFNWIIYTVYILFSYQVWLFIGIAFFLLIMSIHPLTTQFLPEAIGVWSFSVIVGLIAIGIPQGLGVKEGILTLALQAVVPLPVALSISIFSRFWLITCELLATFLWWGFDRLLPRILRKGY